MIPDEINESAGTAVAEEKVIDPIDSLPEAEGKLVRAWKAQGFQVHMATFDVDAYYFRVPMRREWQKLLDDQEALISGGKIQNSRLQNMLEEAIVIRFVLFPKVDLGTVQDLPAGVVTRLSNLILEAAGFDQQVSVQKL